MTEPSNLIEISHTKEDIALLIMVLEYYTKRHWRINENDKYEHAEKLKFQLERIYKAHP